MTRSFLTIPAAAVAAALVWGAAPAAAAPTGAPQAAPVAAPKAAPLASPSTAEPQTVGADPLPTWQLNGVVWSQAIVGRTVYATGSFTKARPSGVPAGDPSEIDVANLFAYDLVTGERVASFDHQLNAQGLVVKASPDGSRIYVGGDFTTVDGVARGHVAAFSTADGSLVSGWAPNIGGQVRALAVSDQSVFVGGNYPSANGEARSSLASFAVSNARMSDFAPTIGGVSAYVWSMVLAPKGDRLVVGGSFQTLNGTDVFGMGALSLAGDLLPWAANQRVRTFGTDGAITALDTDGTSIYGSGYSFQDKVNAKFEGQFSADPDTGELSWVNDCLGDNYDNALMDGVLYAVNHTHDCSAVDEFPDTKPRARWQKAIALRAQGAAGVIERQNAYGWDFRGLARPKMLQWYPDLDFGTFTSSRQAAWSVEAKDGYVVLGGEFPTVNGKAQQGLTRYAVPGVGGPRTSKPIVTTATPRARNVDAQRVQVQWSAAWDRDDRTLTYELFRKAATGTAVRLTSTTVDSQWWNLPASSFDDTTATPGQSYRYQVRVSDSDGNVVWGALSSAVTVGSPVLGRYGAAVRRDGATHLWPLGDTGPSVVDEIGLLDASSTGLTFAQPGTGAGGTSVRSVATAKVWPSLPVAHPRSASLEAWVKTSSTSGGRILGFGNIGAGGAADAQHNDLVLYLNNAGKVFFALNAGGVTNGSFRAISSTRSVNDNLWHHVVATVGPDGTQLFVDGRRVARDQNPPAMGSFVGYWRMLSDTTTSLPSRPSSAGLVANLEQVAVYPGVLTAAQVQDHFVAAGRTATWPTASLPAGSYAATVLADQPDTYWRLSEPSGTVAVDSSRNGVDGTIAGAAAYNQVGAITGAGAIAGDGALRLNGTTGLVAAKDAWLAPKEYTAETWFRSTSTAGGRLVGFGSAATGLSATADRQVCLLSDGRLQAGVTPAGRVVTAESTRAYNDGAWHHVVLTQGATGLRLYVDAELVASNAETQAGDYAGFWRAGGDKCLGGTTSSYPAATIDEVAVYPRALDLAAVRAHYRAGGYLPPNLAPVAEFSAAADLELVSVDASASADPDGTLASYAWSWGDGTTSTGRLASHTYAASGTYDVTLTVTDDRGETASRTRTLPVTVNMAPAAAFTVAADLLAVTVDASLSTDAEGALASYAWDFGDGTRSTGPTATHAYTAPGTYTIALTVTDARGTASTTTRDVTVEAGTNVAPVAAFTSATTWLTASLDASASSDADGTITSYAWDFGDGTTGTGVSVTHAYAAAGTFPVRLTVRDQQGGTTTLVRDVTVAVNPAVAEDDFARTVTGAWGQAALGGSWGVSGTATRWNVASGVGTFTATAAGTGGTATLAALPLALDRESAVSFATDKAPTGTGQFFSLVGRRVDATNDYRTKVLVAPSGAVTAYLTRTLAGVESVLATAAVPGLSVAPGDVVRVRMQVEGGSPTTLRARVWKVGASEPSAWTLMTTDASAGLQVAGTLALYPYLPASSTNAPVTYRVDDVWAGPLR